MFFIELAQASERRSFAGSPTWLTFSMSSSPSSMLTATLGALLVESAGEILQQSLSYTASSSSHACSGLDRRLITLQAS
jgi:hypothetical protein